MGLKGEKSTKEEKLKINIAKKIKTKRWGQSEEGPRTFSDVQTVPGQAP